MNNPVAEFPIAVNAARCHSARQAKRRETAAMPAKGPTSRLHDVSSRRAGADATPSTLSSSDNCQTLFEANLPVIKGVVRFVCHRQRLDPTQAEEFESEVMLRLVEDDYDVLRRFQARSSLRTYLTVVIQRLFLDYRNRLWGKWRPSAEALRLGPAAVRLERLLARDGYGFEQACEVLWTDEGVTLTRSQLSDISARLPIRLRRSVVGEEVLETVAQDRDLPDAAVMAGDPREISLRIRRALTPAVQTFSAQDLLILRLRFQDGLGVADIARALMLEQKPLYRRFESLLRRMRTALEAAGIDREAALDLMSRGDADISLALLGDSPGVAVPVEGRPSTGA
jgi:RNA polymerase sigma factor (sigma-70 family)